MLFTVLLAAPVLLTAYCPVLRAMSCPVLRAMSCPVLVLVIWSYSSCMFLTRQIGSPSVPANVPSVWNGCPLYVPPPCSHSYGAQRLANVTTRSVGMQGRLCVWDSIPPVPWWPPAAWTPLPNSGVWRLGHIFSIFHLRR